MISPLVSIVIPTYNRAVSVARALESALNQSYKNIEIVVCDNASTDNTEKVIEEFEASDSRIIYHRNPTNIGPVANWLKGIQESKGEYVKILFSDDWLSGDCIELLLQPFLKHPSIGFSLADALIVSRTKQMDVSFKLQPNAIVSSERYLCYASLNKVPVSPIYALFRREDLLNFFCVKIPYPRREDEDYYYNRGIGYDAWLYWKTAAARDGVYYVKKHLVYLSSENDDTPSISMTTPDKILANGYSHAFKFFVATSNLEEKTKRRLIFCHRYRYFLNPVHFAKKALRQVISILKSKLCR